MDFFLKQCISSVFMMHAYFPFQFSLVSVDIIDIALIIGDHFSSKLSPLIHLIFPGHSYSCNISLNSLHSLRNLPDSIPGSCVHAGVLITHLTRAR